MFAAVAFLQAPLHRQRQLGFLVERPFVCMRSLDMIRYHTGLSGIYGAEGESDEAARLAAFWRAVNGFVWCCIQKLRVFNATLHVIPFAADFIRTLRRLVLAVHERLSG